MRGKIITAELICEFKKQLCLEEKSEATINKYIHDVTMFADYMENKPVTKERAIKYKQSLFDNGYAVRSVNSIIASVNSLFAFMGLLNCKLKSIKIQQQIFLQRGKRVDQRRIYPSCENSGIKRKQTFESYHTDNMRHGHKSQRAAIYNC